MNRLRRLRSDEDSGAVLILVLLVSLMIMLLTATVAMATTGQIVPAKVSQDDAVAQAAAEAGLEDFTASVNSNCVKAGICSWILGNPHASLVPVATGSTATFSWRIVNSATYSLDGYVRVVSTGRSPDPGSRVKTLVADVRGASSPFDYAYYTQFETVGSSLINARFPARNIVIDNASAMSAANQSGSSGVATWSTPPAAGPGSPATCDRYYYDDAVLGAGRSSIGKVNGADWYQSGSLGGTGYVNYGRCEVTFGSGATFNGPVASRDAMLLSHTTVGGTGPTFKSRVDTYWGNADANSPLAPSAPNTFRKQDLPVDGGVSASSTASPTTNPFVPTLPTSLSDAPTTSRCTYVGPTRVRLLGDGNALITSPQTTGSGPAGEAAACRTNTDGTISGNGVVSARVPMAGTTIYVQNNPVAPVPSTPIFKILKAVAGTVPAATIAQSNPTWTGSPQAAWVTSVQTAVTGSSHTDIATAVSAALPANPSSPSSGAVRYQVTETSTDLGTTTTPGSSSAVTAWSDPLLQGTNGYTRVDSQKHSVKYVAHVASQTAQCSLLGVGGICIGVWQWPATWTADTYTATTTRDDTTYVDASVAATSTFPLSTDVTQYSPNNGDVYIEGTQIGSSSIAAEGDIVVTNSLTYGTNGTDAIDLVALNNTRVYHPVACTDSTAASLSGTTAGFCPNDITGLYPKNGVPSWSLHPSQQYADLRSDLANLQISAGIFALLGSFYTDNYDRGAESNGTITVRGGVWQRHRGALGEQWEIKSSDTGTRHHTGYGISYVYDSTLGADSRGLPYRPAPAASVANHVWSIVSMSTTTTLSAS